MNEVLRHEAWSRHIFPPWNRLRLIDVTLIISRSQVTLPGDYLLSPDESHLCLVPIRAPLCSNQSARAGAMWVFKSWISFQASYFIDAPFCSPCPLIFGLFFPWGLYYLIILRSLMFGSTCDLYTTMILTIFHPLIPPPPPSLPSADHSSIKLQEHNMTLSRSGQRSCSMWADCPLN